MVVLTFHSSTLWKQRQRDPREFEASLVYRASSRTARATQRNLVVKNKKQTFLDQLPTFKCYHVGSGD